MPKMKGPAILLAQFMRDEKPYNNIENIGRWVAGLGYVGVQIPTWDKRIIDLDRAAQSKTYCDDYKGKLKEIGLEPSELGGYLAGQVLAVHPAYEVMFEMFHPEGLKGDARTEWASGELKKCSLRLGPTWAPMSSRRYPAGSHGTWFIRGLNVPRGLLTKRLRNLAKRWRPLLDLAHDNGTVFAYELHPGSDIYDGATYEMFLDFTDNHPAACLNYDPSHLLLQQLDYLEFIRLYGERVKGFHVKDAEFRPTGRVGVYGGYQSWRDAQVGSVRWVTAKSILGEFSRSCRRPAMKVGATLEWECCVKSPAQGAAEGAPFISDHIIETTEVAFDDFAGGEVNPERNRKILGLGG